jgi:signal transduction histidine kinase
MAARPGRLYAGGSNSGGHYGGHAHDTEADTETGSAPRRAAPDGLYRFTGPISAAVLAVAAAGVATSAQHVSAGRVAAATAALVVVAAGIGFIFSPWCNSGWAAVSTFVAVGLAGSVLAGLLPGSPSVVIVYLALAGLGICDVPGWELVAAVGVFAAMNVALLLTSPESAGDLASQDLGFAFIFAIGVFTRKARVSRALAEQAQARAEDLLTQLRASQAAQAEAAALTERARLAREIHDVLAHALSGLVLSLDTMELLGRKGASDPAVLDQLMEQVARGQRIARDGLADTRRAIATLRGDELPGAELLPRLVQDTNAATGIQARLTVTGIRRSLPPEAGLALYRTAQEALTNTAKYAGHDARAQLRLSYLPGSVELLVENTRAADDDAADGHVAGSPAVDGPAAGSPAAEAEAELTFGGYGLTGMRERAELLGGTLTAGPTSTGFSVRLRLPAPPPSGAAPGPAA